MDRPPADITLAAQVNEFVDALFTHSGAGSLSQSGDSFTLDFGTIVAGSGDLVAALAVLNAAPGSIADLLSGSFDLSLVDPAFGVSGFSPFANIAAGNSFGGLGVVFGSSVEGSYVSSLVLHTRGTNASGFDAALSDRTLVLRGIVAPVPEPGTGLLIAFGLTGGTECPFSAGDRPLFLPRRQRCEFAPPRKPKNSSPPRAAALAQRSARSRSVPGNEDDASHASLPISSRARAAARVSPTQRAPTRAQSALSCAALSARAAHQETRDVPERRTRSAVDPVKLGAMLWVAFGSAVLGIALRALTSLNDLWFDEVWTLDLLREHVRSSLDVFTRFKHSNNHHLSSLWMWWMGPDAWGPLYRLPSVLASVATIALSGLIAGRRGRLEACVAVTLSSWSYLLIHFGGEARGYSAVIVFTLLAWYALLRFDDLRTWKWAVVYWLAVVLGFFAHLEFIVGCLGIGAWTLWRCLFHRTDRLQGLGDLLRLHAVPTVCLLFFYWVAIRGMQLGGGRSYDLASVLVQTASYAVGGPASGELARLAALAMLAGGCAALVWFARRSDEWIFYLLGCATPLLLLGIRRPEQLYPRYFMVSVVLYLVLVAPALAALIRRGASGRVLGCVVLALFIAGNALHVATLVRYGRGQYLAALRFMERESGGRELTVGSDHPLRNPTLVKYYARYLEHPERVRNVDVFSRSEELRAMGGPEWMIEHRFELPASIRKIPGYQLVSVYRYSDLSGWHWLLWHNQNRPSVAPAEPLYR